jgi:Domain of unknown function (DUF4410)
MRSPIRNLIYVLIALVISACAESSVPTGSADSLTMEGTSSARHVVHGSIGNGASIQIIVFPFATSVADATLNQSLATRLYRNYSGEDETTSQLQLAQFTAQNICIEVANSLANKGWNAACQPRGVPLTGGNRLIVDGAFTDLSEGNRLRRMVIGLGADASVVDTQVGLYQYSNGNSTQLLSFTTHADSGKMPGVAIAGPAGAAAATTIGVDVAATGVKNATPSTAYLTDASARQIVSQVNNYLSQRAGIPQLPIPDDAAGSRRWDGI